LYSDAYVIIGPWRRGDELCGLILWAHRTLTLDVQADPKMGQQMTVPDLALKELSAPVIHEYLTPILGAMQLYATQLRATFAKDTFFL
jgi:hypothetical protein